MADHYGAARSNWFKVKDAQAFKNAMASVPGLGVWEENGYFGVYEDDGDDSGFWPSYRYVITIDAEGQEREDLDEDFDLFACIAEHLQEGQVAIFMNGGAEKLRYITGHAVAINWKGHRFDLDLSDIYDKAYEAWGVQPTFAEYSAPIDEEP